MRFLLHGNLTPAVADALRRHGHSAHAPQELEIDALDPSELLKVAREKRVEIITTDQALASAPYELSVLFDRVIVFLQLEGGDVEQDDAIDRLFERYKRLTPGRLYTVTGTRVKIRQLPST
jgi:predicted nuclease of predicted toxin-antitoxin system